jgi:hypothetical protein
MRISKVLGCGVIASSMLVSSLALAVVTKGPISGVTPGKFVHKNATPTQCKIWGGQWKLTSGSGPSARGDCTVTRTSAPIGH